MGMVYDNAGKVMLRLLDFEAASLKMLVCQGMASNDSMSRKWNGILHQTIQTIQDRYHSSYETRFNCILIAIISDAVA